MLLTGATGFIGKVTLALLLRERQRRGIEEIFVLVRARDQAAAEERFARLWRTSPCLAGTSAEDRARVTVVAGDVTGPVLGLAPARAARLASSLTHIIHLAASIAFDLPLAQAARINIGGALGVLAFAQRCLRLRRLVHTSTAYVTPHTTGPILPALVPLPFDPAQVYAGLHGDNLPDARLYRESGHPNSYTFTKCLAEHLLAQRRQGVPLTIVRPSIVGACGDFPLPGWIDSPAAYAGFLALFMAGRLDVILADPEVRLDVVPCDQVAGRLVAEAFTAAAPPFVIRHAVVGLSRSQPIKGLTEIARQVRRELPTGARESRARLRPAGLGFALDHWVSHRLPLALGAAWLRLSGDRKGQVAVRRTRQALSQLARLFPYFTQHQFDFRDDGPDAAADEAPGFVARDYHATMVRGVHRHLLRSIRER